MRSGQNPLPNPVARITYPGEQGHVTGFYRNFQSEIFLVTNRHVVLDEKENHEPDELTYHSRNFRDVANGNPVTLDNSNGQGEAWFTHPDAGKTRTADYFEIAVIPFHQRVYNIDRGSESAQTTSRGITREMQIPHHPKLAMEDVGQEAQFL